MPRLLLPLVPVVAALLGASASVAAAETYAVDPVHTTTLFKIDHFGMSHFLGRFNDVSGTIVWDNADPAKSSVNYEIKAESIDTAFKKRDQHLVGPDFFDAKQFPTLTFKSTAIKKAGDAFTVDGDLTVHGVTKPISVAVKKVGEGKDPMGASRIGFWSTFTIKRSDYGMAFMQGALGDEVEITLSTEGWIKPEQK